MRPNGSAKTLERRRRRAVALLMAGASLSAVARQIRASISSVWRWWDAHQHGGDAALKPKPVPGRPSKLSAKQRQRLWSILLAGAVPYGFPNEIWTLNRIAQVIQKEFGVEYHPCHIWKCLRAAGWSCQVPERRAIQRDEAAIAQWKRCRWPHIKKGPKTWRPSGVPG